MESHYSEKNKGSNIFFIILILIIFLVIFFHNSILQILKINLLKKDYFKAINSINLKLPEKFDCNIINENVILLDNKHINSIDNKGNILWKKDIDSSLYSRLGQDIIYLGDKDYGSITAIDYNGSEIWSINIDKVIKNIFVQNEILIIYTNNEENLDEILLVDKTGEVVSDIILNKGKFISGYLSNDSKHIAITTIEVSNGNIESSILFYDINGDLIWKTVYNDEIVQKITFIDNFTTLCVSDQKIRLLKNNTLMWSKSLNKIFKDILIYNNKIYILTEGRIQSFDYNGKISLNKNIDKDFYKLYIYDDNLFVLGKNNIKTIDMNGRNVSEYISEEPIKKMIINNEKFIIIKENELIINKYNKKN